jgi:hypothetical protein
LAGLILAIDPRIELVDVDVDASTNAHDCALGGNPLDSALKTNHRIWPSVKVLSAENFETVFQVALHRPSLSLTSAGP